MLDPDTQSTFNEISYLGKLAQLSLEARAERKAIELYRVIEKTVRILSDLYEEFPILNEAQPPSFSGENSPLPMSLDEWAITLEWSLDWWEEKLNIKSNGGEG